MKERPILFSGPMVRAILEGRKTMTRRVMFKDDPRNHMPWQVPSGWQDGDLPIHCPYGQPGDRLWVRETWAEHPDDEGPIYRATDPGWDDNNYGIKWRPSIHMPRKYSRITLEITGVRVERVQDISDEDAADEGIMTAFNVRTMFEVLWDSINAKRGYSWESNPWVWVVEFKRI